MAALGREPERKPAGGLGRGAIELEGSCELGQLFAEAPQRLGVSQQIIGKQQASCGAVPQMLNIDHVPRSGAVFRPANGACGASS
jgi:hypothetical protein